MADSSSLASVDPQQSIAASERLADAGYAAVDGAYRHSIASAGAETARTAGSLTVGQVIVGSLEGVTHLCDRLGLDARSVFAAALKQREDTLRTSHQAQTDFDRDHSATIRFWADLPTPATAVAEHAHTVLTLLHDRPEGVTSSQLRDLGVKNPSNVVMRLIRSGHPVERIPLTRGGAKGRQALYRLDRAKA
jgi:hypothetical protein